MSIGVCFPNFPSRNTLCSVAWCRPPIPPSAASPPPGYRMACPQRCPEDVYKVMQRCWQYNPEERPKFSELQRDLAAVKKKWVRLAAPGSRQGFRHDWRRTTHFLPSVFAPHLNHPGWTEDSMSIGGGGGPKVSGLVNLGLFSRGWRWICLFLLCFISKEICFWVDDVFVLLFFC